MTLSHCGKICTTDEKQAFTHDFLQRRVQTGGLYIEALDEDAEWAVGVLPTITFDLCKPNRYNCYVLCTKK